VIANRYLEDYILRPTRSVDVVYTKFVSASVQTPVVETLLPLGSLTGRGAGSRAGRDGEAEGARSGEVPYEFYPSASDILEELVPTSFKIKLFKCFLDAAVSDENTFMATATEQNVGTITQVIGSTFDAQFAEEHLPELYNAVKVQGNTRACRST
jgi:F-type H+-transporting ATPase subunit gamma